MEKTRTVFGRISASERKASPQVRATSGFEARNLF
jgi:hypothetical protein